MPSMHKVLIGLMTLVMPATLAAQKLTPGTWTGTIAPPNQDAIEASFVAVFGILVLISAIVRA